MRERVRERGGGRERERGGGRGGQRLNYCEKYPKGIFAERNI